MKLRSKAKITAICACLWAILGTVPHIDAQGIYTYDTLGPNLIENGGFGELAGWTIYGYVWSPQTGGESGGYISFQRYAYQDVPTQPGSTYLLQFWTQRFNAEYATTSFGLFGCFVFNWRLAARDKLISEGALRVEHDLFTISAFDATTT
jgi:hypothetical protein